MERNKETVYNRVDSRRTILVKKIKETSLWLIQKRGKVLRIALSKCEKCDPSLQTVS